MLKAIKSDSFDFCYQPLVDTKSGMITGAEALIHWIEPDGRVIYPESFIPFFEKLGLIDQINKIAISNSFYANSSVAKTVNIFWAYFH